MDTSIFSIDLGILKYMFNSVAKWDIFLLLFRG